MKNTDQTINALKALVKDLQEQQKKYEQYGRTAIPEIVASGCFAAIITIKDVIKKLNKIIKAKVK